MPCYEPKLTWKEWLINGATTFALIIGFGVMLIVFN